MQNSSLNYAERVLAVYNKSLLAFIIVFEKLYFDNGGDDHMWLVVSDSHDNLRKLEKAVRLAIDRNVDCLFHCGDISSPFAARILKDYTGELHVVKGNNDGEELGLKGILGPAFKRGPIVLEMSGKRVVMMHEPFGINGVIDCDYLFYGHTHKIDIKPGTPFVINPGELCGYLSGKSTVVLLDEAGNDYEIVEL